MTESQTPLAEIEMSPVFGPVQGAIQPPGSKSITNRALIIAALADGTSRLTGTLASEDTHVMLESLRRLGLEWTDEGNGTISIQGCGGNIPADKADLWLENSEYPMSKRYRKVPVGTSAVQGDHLELFEIFWIFLG